MTSKDAAAQTVVSLFDSAGFWAAFLGAAIVAFERQWLTFDEPPRFPYLRVFPPIFEEFGGCAQD
ncbi:hypothetical protein [Mesorhizobium loti]|uniref:hypothetical protein n=1 Tax=Rhizobium loti TaxID=381 RepID=UPI00126916EA|nr:hypothetical protein [Mesorhizobium loti]